MHSVHARPHWLPIHIGTALEEGIMPPKFCRCGIIRQCGIIVHRISVDTSLISASWCQVLLLLMHKIRSALLTHADGMPQHCLTSASRESMA